MNKDLSRQVEGLAFEILIFFFCPTAQHVGSSSPTRTGTPCPLHWKHGLLITGPPGKSQKEIAFDGNFSPL